MESELRNEDGWVLPKRGRICPDPLFEVGLHYSAQVGLDEENWIASEGSNPVAPDLNNTLKLRATMRSFSFSASAGSIISRTRDLVHLPSEWRSAFSVPDMRTCYSAKTGETFGNRSRIGITKRKYVDNRQTDRRVAIVLQRHCDPNASLMEFVYVSTGRFLPFPRYPFSANGEKLDRA
jgi:hypothetical protein